MWLTVTIPIKKILYLSGIYVNTETDEPTSNISTKSPQKREKMNKSNHALSKSNDTEDKDDEHFGTFFSEKKLEQDNLKILSECYQFALESSNINDDPKNEKNNSEKYLLTKYHKYSQIPLYSSVPEGALYLISLLNNIGICYFQQQKYHFAEKLFRKCITQYHELILHYIPEINSSGWQYTIEHDHKEYLYILFNLANVLNHLYHFEEAEHLYLLCLMKFENLMLVKKSLEYEYHPDYISILSNLGYLYSNQSEYSKLAEYIYNDCLSKRKYILTLILNDKSEYEKKIENNHRDEYSNHNRHYAHKNHLMSYDLSYQHNTKENDQDILQNDIYSFDENHQKNVETNLEILQKYHLLEEKYTIFWLYSLFNLCCFYIERNIYEKENIEELLQQCLDKSKEIWGEKNQFLDRILEVWNRMNNQKSKLRKDKFQPLWNSIYSKSTHHCHYYQNHNHMENTNYNSIKSKMTECKIKENNENFCYSYDDDSDNKDNDGDRSDMDDTNYYSNYYHIFGDESKNNEQLKPKLSSKSFKSKKNSSSLDATTTTIATTLPARKNPIFPMISRKLNRFTYQEKREYNQGWGDIIMNTQDWIENGYQENKSSRSFSPRIIHKLKKNIPNEGHKNASI